MRDYLIKVFLMSGKKNVFMVRITLMSGVFESFNGEIPC